MTKSSVQFFATPEEIFEFLKSLLNERPYHVAVCYGHPLNCVDLGIDFHLDDIKSVQYKHSGEIFISIDKLDLSARSRMEFFDKNDGVIALKIGARSQKQIVESSISFSTADSEKRKVGQKALRQIRSITQAGVTAVNRNTGEKAKISALRFTKGAREAYQAGVEIKPFAGTAMIELH